jgi:hypothetical protein
MYIHVLAVAKHMPLALWVFQLCATKYPPCITRTTLKAADAKQAAADVKTAAELNELAKALDAVNTTVEGVKEALVRDRFF